MSSTSEGSPQGYRSSLVSENPHPDLAVSGGLLGSDRYWHLSFGALLILTVGSFAAWGFGEVGHTGHHLILLVTIAFGFFMAFNIGGNDVANSFGTSVGAGTLTMKQALLLAAIFEVAGAVLAGGEVTDTVRSGIVDLGALDVAPLDFAFIMMAALLGAALWLLVATRKGWPVSTTHAIIGGIVGAAVTVGFVTGTGGLDMVQWNKIGQIALSWVLSPVLGLLAAVAIFRVIKGSVIAHNDVADEQIRALREKRTQARISFEDARIDARHEGAQDALAALTRDADRLDQPEPVAAEVETEPGRQLLTASTELTDTLNRHHRGLQLWVPLIAAVGSLVISAMLLFKGLKNLHLGLDPIGNLLIMVMVGACAWMSVFFFAKTLQNRTLGRATFLLFSWMQVFTAAAFAFSHGSNDIANAVGPFAAVLDVLATDSINTKAAVPTALLLACGVALVAGLWFIGRNVIRTVGTGLTTMHPASGFAAELSAASVVMGASVAGLPVSSTHILIGAVLGVGLVNRRANWALMKPIGLAWVITLPAAALIGSITVLLLRVALG